MTTNAETPPPGSIVFMSGTVSDTAFRELGGAKVDVLDGPEAGKSVIADAKGRFSFSGTFNEATQFRATSEGHVTAIRTLQPFCARCNPNWWINFTLEVLDPPVNLAGQHTLTFVADSACTSLPDDIRTRSFTATISSSPNPATSYVDVALGGALAGWDVVPMGVSGNYVAFWLETLVEQPAPNTFVLFGGLVAGSIDRSPTSTIALPFYGSIDHGVTTSDIGRVEACFQSQAAVHAKCESFNHQLILTRR